MSSFGGKIKRKFWKKERKKGKKEVKEAVFEIENPPKWWLEIQAIKKLNERIAGTK